MVVITGLLLVVGVMGIVYGRRRAAGVVPARKRLLDYVALMLVVVGGNLSFRVIDGLPGTNPRDAAAACVAMISAFAVMGYNVKRVTGLDIRSS